MRLATGAQSRPLWTTLSRVRHSVLRLEYCKRFVSLKSKLFRLYRAGLKDVQREKDKLEDDLRFKEMQRIK